MAVPYRRRRCAAHLLYEYQPDRKALRTQEFLAGFRGYLHADGHEVCHNLPDGMTVVGCWAHLRRKFDEALKVLPAQAKENSLALVGKRYCDKLFDLERAFDRLMPEQRYKQRQKTSKPEMGAFFAWADSCNAIPKSPVGIAVYYARSQRNYLERYLLDGRLEISNNRAEHSIKPFVIGRKNFLFANTPRGAKASAVIFSIIETAKEYGLNPFGYLTHIFECAPTLDIQNPEQLGAIMPYQFLPAARL